MKFGARKKSNQFEGAHTNSSSCVGVSRFVGQESRNPVVEGEGGVGLEERVQGMRRRDVDAAQGRFGRGKCGNGRMGARARQLARPLRRRNQAATAR